MSEDQTSEKAFELMGILPGTYSLKPVSRLQKLISRRLTEASTTIPSFTLTMTVEMDALMTLRENHNGSSETRISVNDLVVKAAAIALMTVRTVNSSYSDDGIAEHSQADVAIAVASKYGLITPIIRGADSKPVTEIAKTARDLVDRANAGKLAPDEYMGGSFCVSNLGMFGIEQFTSIINPPHSAILSVGNTRTKPRHDGSDWVPYQAMSVSLTCDHRIVDGATGAKWLQAFREAIESPAGKLMND